MRMPGLKYFRILNIGRLLLEGTEVTATAAALNAAAAGAGLPMRVGQVTLNGLNPTRVSFIDDQVAVYTGTGVEPFDLTAGVTIIANADGAGAETLTIPDTEGTWVGANTGFGDIEHQADNQFYIDVDGLGPELVELDLGNCDTGANTAAEMQAVIRALGGGVAPYDAVTVAFVEEAAGPPQTGTYTITSASTTGTGSSIELTPGPANVLNELALDAFSSTQTDGLGAGADNEAVTAVELAAWINGVAVNFEAEATAADEIAILGTVAGGTLVIGDGTANAEIGFTNLDEEVGAVGLGYASDMLNADYTVIATVEHDTAAEIAGISVDDKAVDGFALLSAEAARTYDINLLIVGETA